GRKIRADEDHALVAARQGVDHVEASLAHGQLPLQLPSALRIASRSLSDRSDLWCHDALFSAAGMPLPLTVWQMTARGRSAGAAAASRKTWRSWPTLWPLHSNTRKPKLVHLSASGSMFWMSKTLPADWILL